MQSSRYKTDLFCCRNKVLGTIYCVSLLFRLRVYYLHVYKCKNKINKLAAVKIGLDRFDINMYVKVHNDTRNIGDIVEKIDKTKDEI
jgi:hypothetical protein